MAKASLTKSNKQTKVSGGKKLQKLNKPKKTIISPTAKKEDEPESSLRQRLLRIALLSIGGISLFLAQSTLWVNHVIFNQETFTKTTTEVILSQRSRDAISQSIVDKAFENRPVADRLVGDRAVTFISSMLESDISEKALTKVADKSYAYITSSDRQDIAIDLSAIKDPLAGIISFAESRGREVKFDAASIPDKITLIESDELPDIASYIRLMIIASGILWLTVISTFSAYIFISRQGRIKRLYSVGLTIIIVSLLSLSSGPFVPPVISSFVANIQLRGVVNDLVVAYLQPFLNQMYLTILLTGLVLLIVRFRWIFVSAWHAAYDAVNNRIASKSTK